MASYIAADADRVTFSSKERSFLNCYFSLANAELSQKEKKRCHKREACHLNEYESFLAVLLKVPGRRLTNVVL